MKRQLHAKTAILILLPVLGTSFIAWRGSQSPARQILGTWQTDNGSVIEFKADGTYTKRGWLMLNREAAKRSHCYSRWWGTYSFINSTMLRTHDERTEDYGACGDAVKVLATSDYRVRFEGDHAMIDINGPGGLREIWKSIESPVND